MMHAFVCGAPLVVAAVGELPEVGDGGCCYAAVTEGPQACTCWEEITEPAKQQPLDKTAEPTTRAQMCDDCAYRPASPEKTGAAGYAGDANELEYYAAKGHPFWCHQGMVKVVRLRHPAGVEIAAHDAGYRPPVVDGVPYQADGQPAQRCAGWDARRRAVEHQAGEVT